MHARTPNTNLTRLAADFLRSGAKYVSHYVVLTPALAQDLLERSRYQQQRTLDKGNVKGFLYRIRKDRFRENSNIDICVTPNGQMHLVDGQHRLTAIASQQLSIPVCIQLCRVDDQEAVRARYDSHDSAGKPRTMNDLIRDMDVDMGISRNDAKNLALAVNHIRFGFTADRSGDMTKRLIKKDGEEVRALMWEWVEEAGTLFAIFHAAKKGQAHPSLYTGPVIGVALITLRYQPRADEFWMKAIFNDGLRHKDPAQTLLKWFGTDKGRAALAPERARACSAAWGAHYEGRGLANMHSDSEISLMITGTPVRIEGSAKA